MRGLELFSGTGTGVNTSEDEMTESALPTDPRTPLHLSNRGGSVVNIVKMPPETKRCSTCHEVKPLDQFNRNRTQKDGLHYRCRSCASVSDSKLYRSDTPAGERCRANARDRGRIVTEKRKNDPEHPYSWTSRECMWRHYRIVCVPGCSANRGYLCREHYNALWSFQDGRCGLCGGLLARGMKPYPSADHWHRDPDGTGPIRGLLHGGKNGCNVRLLNAYEKGRYIQDEVLREACREYLAHPPSARMTGSDFSVTPPPDPKYLVTEPQEESRDHRGDPIYQHTNVTWTPSFNQEA